MSLELNQYDTFEDYAKAELPAISQLAFSLQYEANYILNIESHNEVNNAAYTIGQTKEKILACESELDKIEVNTKYLNQFKQHFGFSDTGLRTLIGNVSKDGRHLNVVDALKKLQYTHPKQYDKDYEYKDKQQSNTVPMIVIVGGSLVLITVAILTIILLNTSGILPNNPNIEPEVVLTAAATPSPEVIATNTPEPQRLDGEPPIPHTAGEIASFTDAGANIIGTGLSNLFISPNWQGSESFGQFNYQIEVLPMEGGPLMRENGTFGAYWNDITIAYTVDGVRRHDSLGLIMPYMQDGQAIGVEFVIDEDGSNIPFYLPNQIDVPFYDELARFQDMDVNDPNNPVASYMQSVGWYFWGTNNGRMVFMPNPEN